MLALKLALVVASVLLATQASQRFGHRVGGAVAGMPMIAAPITAVLLLDQSAEQVRAIALATLVCLPAAILHIVTFARCAGRWPWPGCLAAALGAYLLAGAGLSLARLPVAAVCGLALVAPALGWWASPRSAMAAGPVPVPRSELVLRLAAALAMAAAVILGAESLPPAVSGLLLAVPITGSVLPCFTLPRHGAAATAALLAGFTQGLHGFMAFFVVLYLALGTTGKLAAFLLGLGAALLAALAVQRVRVLLLRRAAAG